VEVAYVLKDCPARLIPKAQRPAFLDQVRQEFFVVAALRDEPRAADYPPTKKLCIAYIVKRENAI
jgi:hypothetical protein